MGSQRFERGQWSGEYIDAYGLRGSIQLNVDESEAGVKGSYEVRFRTEDEPQVFRGELAGEAAEGRVRLLLPIGQQMEKGGDAREQVAFDAHVSDAGSHARQAMFGVVEGSPRANLGGGVFIAWLFKKQGE